MNIQLFLQNHFQQIFKNNHLNQDPLVKPTNNSKFGDYQVNGIMAAAKKAGIAPRELAEKIANQINLTNIIEKFEIAGPGFINIFLKNDWLTELLQEKEQSTNLNIQTKKSETVVLDYSSPNIAKEMHVGHLRSTIIGDSVARTLEFLGHKVIRNNHVGDWGTQFGMLIAYLEKAEKESENLTDLENFYRLAKQNYDTDEEFAQKARNYVVKLQQGDEYCRNMWQKLVQITMKQNQAIYDRLNVTLKESDVVGESFYNPMLSKIVEDLQQQNLAVKDDGAMVVFLDEFKNKQGDPLGVIVQKQDGGYLYVTTDIAAVKYRYEKLKADRVLVFSDSRQAQHMQQAWLIAKKAHFIPCDFKCEHPFFGMMLGKDGKPFKTRSGETIKLNSLLDEATQRASTLVKEKIKDANNLDNLNQIIEAVAIGAVKYADLSKNRTTDYIFDWDLMLNFNGNTAPYIQYAYARICSIFRNANQEIENLQGNFCITNDQERQIALKLLQFDEVLEAVAKDCTPHLLCNFLYELTDLFSSFYENHRILESQSRLCLTALISKTLKTGLNLLGITAITKM